MSNIDSFPVFMMPDSSVQDKVVLSSKSHRQALWKAAENRAIPVAMWRLPLQKDTYFLIDFSSKLQTTKIDFEELEAGFAFSPFDNPTNESAFFLKADLLLTFSEKSIINEKISNDVNEEKFQEFKQVFEVNSLKLSTPNSSKTNLEITQNEAQKAVFINTVQQGIEAINEGKMQKVVLSRTKELLLSDDFDIISFFDKLCETYPNAFVSAVYLPSLGAFWIGASPERLVSQNQEGVFKTMALAGTQSARDKEGNTIKPAEALWRQKEIEEQSLVCRYIINCFKKIRVREYEEIGPKTAIAGNLMHLQTDFLVDTKQVNFPQMASVMLELLHPTSAVCGMPKEPATKFILENEGYNREFYSGFLGPVNIEKESHIFVNLRTMKIQGNKATLYAGCGITADSTPEKEWHETEIKCQTLLNVLQN